MKGGFMELPDVILLNISITYKVGITKTGLYEATRGVWRINIDKARTIKYAVAVACGVVKEVYEIKSWHAAGTIAKYETRLDLNEEILSGKYSNRKEFVGKRAKGDIRKLIGREIDYWGQYPVRYKNLKELMKK